MKKVKGKIFIVGSAKELMHNESTAENLYRVCCENITDWLLAENYEIHLAATVFPTADYYIINKAKSIFDIKNNKNRARNKIKKINIFLETAHLDETEKTSPNPQFEIIKEIGYYTQNSFSLWDFVHSKIIDRVDLIIIIGGGSSSPRITELSLQKDKVAINLSDFEDKKNKYEYDVAYKFIAAYNLKAYGIDASTVAFFKPENLENPECKEEFIRNIDIIISKYSNSKYKSALFWLILMVVFIITAALYFLPEAIINIPIIKWKFTITMTIYWSAILAGINGSIFSVFFNKKSGNGILDVKYLVARVVDGCFLGLGFASIFTLIVQYFIIDISSVFSFIAFYSQQKNLYIHLAKFINDYNDALTDKSKTLIAIISWVIGFSPTLSKPLLKVKSIFKY